MKRRLTTGVCDKNARIYSFGGVVDYSVTNNFDIFDTNQFIWSTGSNLNIPPPMDTIAATLLPDGRIVYIGGVTFPGSIVDDTTGQNIISMSEV
jgi:hypothetical protein